MKKYIFGIVCVLLLICIYFFLRPPRFKEVYTSVFRLDYYTTVRWIDDRYVLTAANSQMVVWDVMEGEQVLTYISGEPENYRHPSFLVSSEAQKVAMFNEQVLQVWNFFDAEPFFVWELPGDAPCDFGLLYPNNFGHSADGADVLIGCTRQDINTVYQVNLATNEITPYLNQTWNGIDPFAGETVFGFNEGSPSIYAMNLDTQQVMWRTPIISQPYINFYGINEAALLGCGEDTCFLLDRHTGALQHTFEFDREVYSAYLTNEYVVVIQEISYTITRIEVWDTATGGELRQTDIPLPSSSFTYLRAHALSRDGMLALSFYQWSDTGSVETQWTPVYVYDVATLDRIATLDAHADAVTHLAFDPTGTYLFTGSYDKTFKIWEIGK